MQDQHHSEDQRLAYFLPYDCAQQSVSNQATVVQRLVNAIH